METTLFKTTISRKESDKFFPCHTDLEGQPIIKIELWGKGKKAEELFISSFIIKDNCESCDVYNQPQILLRLSKQHLITSKTLMPDIKNTIETYLEKLSSKENPLNKALYEYSLQLA